jgi:hypothetical protein
MTILAAVALPVSASFALLDGPQSGKEEEAAKKAAAQAAEKVKQVRGAVDEKSAQGGQPGTAAQPMPIPTGVTEQPRALKIAEDKFDWGTIQDTAPVEHKIEFTNTSSEELTLAVAASCGCTAVGMDKNTYKPGEAGSVTAKFDPHGRMGAQTKTITFTVTNPQGKYAQQMVTLTANVEALTWWDPGKLYLNEVDHKTGSPSTIRLIGRKEGFKVTEVTSTSEFVKTKVGEPREIDFNGAKVTEVPIEMVIGEGAPIGNLQAQINVKTNDDRVGTLQPYWIGADIVGDLKAIPTSAIIRTNEPNTPFMTQIKLDSRTGTDFNITSLDVESAKMNVVPDAKKDEATHSYLITLSGVTPNDGGVFQGFLVVSADARGGETMKIPFTAVVRKPQAQMNVPNPAGMGMAPGQMATPAQPVHIDPSKH